MKLDLKMCIVWVGVIPWPFMAGLPMPPVKMALTFNVIKKKHMKLDNFCFGGGGVQHNETDGFFRISQDLQPSIPQTDQTNLSRRSGWKFVESTLILQSYPPWKLPIGPYPTHWGWSGDPLGWSSEPLPAFSMPWRYLLDAPLVSLLRSRVSLMLCKVSVERWHGAIVQGRSREAQ